jgi:hypothetical protein
MSALLPAGYMNASVEQLVAWADELEQTEAEARKAKVALRRRARAMARAGAKAKAKPKAKPNAKPKAKPRAKAKAKAVPKRRPGRPRTLTPTDMERAQRAEEAEVLREQLEELIDDERRAAEFRRLAEPSPSPSSSSSSGWLSGAEDSDDSWVPPPPRPPPPPAPCGSRPAQGSGEDRF